jgi:hypothetical protein
VNSIEKTFTTCEWKLSNLNQRRFDCLLEIGFGKFKNFIMKILNCISVLAYLIAAPLMHSEDKQWWSRKPLTEPSVPPVDGWGRNEVDSFVLHKLKAKNLEPSETASARVLIRRLTFDLTGLPPTPNEIKTFEKEYASDPEHAYEELVDRLLASPRYGERFARHWLDVAKYADTCGYDKDKLRPNAWPYRDYVIRSFNSDKPYDQFIKEQIAGIFSIRIPKTEYWPLAFWRQDHGILSDMWKCRSPRWMEKSPVTWIGMIWFPMYLTVFVPPPFNVPVAMNIRGIRSDRITITVYNPYLLQSIKRTVCMEWIQKWHGQKKSC